MQTHWPYPALIAHRGAGKLAPENTLAAFKLGYAYGYRMFECDVKLSADSVAFLLHDDTLDRTSNGAGAAAVQDWAALSALDAGSWHSAAYAGEPLPTLEQIADFVRAQGCHINLEIKPCPGREAETGRAVANMAAQLWMGADVAPLLSSFSEAALAAAQLAQPSLPRALLVNQIPADWRATLERLGCVAIDANCQHLNPELIASVKTAGYRLLTYTCNDPTRAEELLALGVDGVITDAIDRIQSN